MIDLSTEYLGLKLKNPIVAASSGLTGTMDGIKTLEKSGVAAVVLKSIFEEEILSKVNQPSGKAGVKANIESRLSDTAQYIESHLQEDSLRKYLDLISQAKDKIAIPVIGSINCSSSEDWTYFSSKIEEAGADALELNLFLNPADTENKEFEKSYFNIIENVLNQVNIPVAIKVSKYFTRLKLSIKALSETGISGIVMFNRFYTPEIDIEKMSLSNSRMFTSPEEQSDTLRWIAIMSENVDCDLAATTGIHTGVDVIKMLLAGATVTQIASTLYKNGPDQVVRILKKMEKWMEEKGFQNIDQFRSKVSEAYKEDPVAFEKMQFIKYHSKVR